jgi:hypothetical protein
MAQSRIPNRLRADGAHDAESASQNFRFINPHRLFHGVWLPQWLEERPEVSEKAKKLYSYLTYFAGGKGYAWPSFNHLAEKLHVSRRYVIKLVQELSAHRLITVTNVNRPCKGHCTNYYRFLWHPWMQHSDDGNFCIQFAKNRRLFRLQNLIFSRLLLVNRRSLPLVNRSSLALVNWRSPALVNHRSLP